MTYVFETAIGGRLVDEQGDAERYQSEHPQPTFAIPLINEDPRPAPPPGYVWEQYLFGGTVSGQPFKTILQVIRPIDAVGSSGIVVIEPWHRAGYWTLYSKVREYVTRSHHTAAFVVANRNVLETFIKPQNPSYFESLSLPDTEFIDSEVMAQAGALLRLGAFAGINARKVVLGGQSTVAYWIRRYISQEHTAARLDGAPIFDGYFPAQSALSSPRGIIEDVGVPVIELQGESELIRSFARGGDGAAFRREDGENYRLYEVPGLPHVGTRNGASAARLAQMDCPCSNWSNFPMFEVFHMGLDNLIRWVDRNEPAPSVPRMNTLENGRVIVRDDHGNASGGLRTSYFDVPTGTIHATCGETPEDLSGVRCDFFAWDEPFPEAKLRALYPSHDDYLSKLNTSLDQLVAKRWFLAEDAQILFAQAKGEALYS